MSYVCRLTWFLMLFCSSSLLLAQEPLMWGEGRWGLNAWSQDSDYDGVADPRDAFPLDAAASVDTDGDGMPDEWNLGCDVACQDASGLVLDDDDDNDGALDVDDYLPKDASKVGTPIADALSGIVDPDFEACLTHWAGDSVYAEQVTFIDCRGVNDLSGLRAFSGLEEVNIDNNTTDFSELGYLTNLRVLHQDNGPAPATLEPLRGNLNLVFLQLQGVDSSSFEVDVVNTLLNLEYLGFNYSNIPVLPDFSALTSLNHLNLYRTGTQNIDTVALLPN